MDVSELRALASEYGYTRLELCSTDDFDAWLGMRSDAHKTAGRVCASPLQLAPWAKVIAVTAAPYPLLDDSRSGSIAGYYLAYNRMHKAREELVARIHERGIRAEAVEIPAKPAAERSGLGVYGRNQLIRVHGAGSLVLLACIALGEGFTYESCDRGAKYDPASFTFDAVCGSCTRCIDACPTGALTKDGFDYRICLRSHMLQGTGVPEELRKPMGARLLGCEECQKACPFNHAAVDKRVSPPEGLAMLLDPLRALDPDTRDEYVRRWGETVGFNYAIPNRILVQAIIAGANMRIREALPFIEALCDSPSQVVSDTAKWAVQQFDET